MQQFFSINPGAFVMDGDRVAIVYDLTPDGAGAVLHYLDENGETVMREANKNTPHMRTALGEAHPAIEGQYAQRVVMEDTCPWTGNERTHVTDEALVPVERLRPARTAEIPESRRPQPEEPPKQRRR